MYGTASSSPYPSPTLDRTLYTQMVLTSAKISVPSESVSLISFLAPGPGCDLPLGFLRKGTRDKAKVLPGPAPKNTRSQGLSQGVCCTQPRLGLSEVQAAFCLVRLLAHKAQSCLCCSGPLPWAGLALGISFSTFHKLLATPCWGFANGRPLSAAPSCFSLLFVKAVLQGSRA